VKEFLKALGRYAAMGNTCTYSDPSQRQRAVETLVATLEKQSKEDKLGADLDFSDRATARVEEITRDGLIHEWNRSCPTDRRLQVGDHIVGINGKRGDIFNRLKANMKMDLEVLRPLPFQVELESQGDLGLIFSEAGATLLITEICSKGAVSEWNAINEDLPVKTKDRILEVNGVSGNCAAMISAARGATSLTLKLAPNPLGRQPGVSDLTPKAPAADEEAPAADEEAPAAGEEETAAAPDAGPSPAANNSEDPLSV